MARNIGQRLSKLRQRRAGTDRLDRLSPTEQVSAIAKSTLQEAWQRRALPRPYTRYALGAMQEVDADYTRISIETADRVGKQLHAALAAKANQVELRLQGSVPLNVHIRGVSDVDLLILDGTFITYASGGVQHLQGRYRNPTSRTPVDVLTLLRSECETALATAYPAAKVDKTGSKAIKVFGGSLARPVDVVPSHWHDTLEYQSSLDEHDRGVAILDKNARITIQNLPFLHIRRVSDRCLTTGGGLRKSIRLCKNVKADAEEEGRDITLPSFDIAATMYHANQDALRNGATFELAVLAETQRHLAFLLNNHNYALTLLVPDGSRAIFDTGRKFEGLASLSSELDDLVREVAREQEATYAAMVEPPLEGSRKAIASKYVAP